MSYQKHTWVTEEIIRGKHLNNIEDGIYNEEQRAIEEESTISQNLSNEVSRATQKDNAHDASIAANTSAIATLNGNSSVAGSVDNKIAQSLTDYVQDTDYASTQQAGVVKVDGSTIQIDANGVITSSGGTEYLDEFATLSAITDTEVTFTSNKITMDSSIMLFTNDPEVLYKTMLISPGECVVTFPKQDSQKNIEARIYLL